MGSQGFLGPLTDRLKYEFAGQNPDIRCIDAISPVAVNQTLAALARDPRRPQFISDFRFARDDAGAHVLATILAPCRLTLTIYRVAGGELAAEIVAVIDAGPGSFEQSIDASRLADANSLLLTANEEEFHLHALLDAA